MHSSFMLILHHLPLPIIIIHSSIYFWRKKNVCIKKREQEWIKAWRFIVFSGNFNLKHTFSCIYVQHIMHACLIMHQKMSFTTFGESRSTFIRTNTHAIKIINHLIRGIHKKRINLLLSSSPFDSEKWAEKRFYDDENKCIAHTSRFWRSIKYQWWCASVSWWDWHFNNQHYFASFHILISIWSRSREENLRNF